MGKAKITGRDPRSDRTIEVLVENGIVASITEIKSESEVYLSTGLIDLQVNGGAGFDLNAEQISVETVTGLVDAMLARGVTCFLPTLITAPQEAICNKLRVIADARRADPRVAACVPFVHVEGPHISPLDGYRGAHSAAAVRPPSIREFQRWQSAAGGVVGMVTMSPHFAESAEYIAELVKRGVHVSIGHTHASPEQIKTAVDAGAGLSTHLGNGIAQQIPRHNNPIWSQLADDRLTATFIADGHHLPPEVLKIMLRVKGPQRSILVSDLVSLAGLPPGRYNSSVGGDVELQPNGRLAVLGTNLLAGATSSLVQCIARVVRTTGLSLSDVLGMASANPARYVRRIGQLVIGSSADLIRFRWGDETVIEDVWLAGERVRVR